MPPITVLDYGYKLPSNPTFGDVFWPAMEENIQKMNDHTHSGVDSAPIAALTANVLSTDWGSDLGNGKYAQLITLPGTRTFDNTRIEVRRSTGEMAYPTIEKASSTTFNIFTNDPTLAYVISYV